jgi:hypothetical protein
VHVFFSHSCWFDIRMYVYKLRTHLAVRHTWYVFRSQGVYLNTARLKDLSLFEYRLEGLIKVLI